MNLTSREKGILTMIAQGLKASAIAQKIGVSTNTVRNYQTSLYRKLGVTNAAGAVAAGIFHGFLKKEEWNG